MRSVAILVISLAIFASCTTERKVLGYLNNHPDLSAKYCSEKYPVKDSIITVTKYIKADNKDYSGLIDTLSREKSELAKQIAELQRIADADHSGNCEDYKAQIRIMSVRLSEYEKYIIQLNAKYKPCIPDTVNNTVTIEKEVTAKTDLANQKAIEAEKQRDIFKVLFFVAVGLCALIFIFRK